MALPEFDYIAAKSYEEASKLMASMGSECVVMSGGTDVILQIPKFVSRGMKTVIDLKSVPEQTRLEFVEGEGLYVGANTKLFDIQSSPVVLDKMPAPAPRFTPMTCICPACTTASSSTPPTRMRLLRASTFPRH